MKQQPSRKRQRDWMRLAVTVKVLEVQDMARLVLMIALVLRLSRQHFEMPTQLRCGKVKRRLKEPILRNEGVCYRHYDIAHDMSQIYMLYGDAEPDFFTLPITTLNVTKKNLPKQDTPASASRQFIPCQTTLLTCYAQQAGAYIVATLNKPHNCPKASRSPPFKKFSSHAALPNDCWNSPYITCMQHASQGTRIAVCPSSTT
jgi:hypothetical protein